MIQKAIDSGNIERAMAAISVCSVLQYRWNQSYTDDKLEEYTQKISDLTQNDAIKRKKTDGSVVLFYDGFGLDIRGLAYIYLKALISLGKKLIYVVPKEAKGRQTEIDLLFNNRNVIKEYIDNRSTYRSMLEDIQGVFLKYSPGKAFFYSLPEDISGVVAFMHLAGVSDRFFIDLTDHAFWLGRNSFDYCVEFREYGSCIANLKRHIDEKKIIILPFYPFINHDKQFEGFPFDTKGKKVVFSGGALYKTFDVENTYYKMIGRILELNADVVFVYAGDGDSSGLNELKNRYEGRVFHIKERSDLFQLMKNISIYINTYPIMGGLMTQYAAVAGKIPVILKYDDDCDGTLIDQEKREIVYNSAAELVEDVTKLLSNSEYMEKRQALLKNSVITETEFRDQLEKVLSQKHSDYSYKIHEIDTVKMKKAYYDNFDINSVELDMASGRNISLIRYLIKPYIRKAILRVIKKREV